jgi:hypothetical protein
MQIDPEPTFTPREDTGENLTMRDMAASQPQDSLRDRIVTDQAIRIGRHSGEGEMLPERVPFGPSYIPLAGRDFLSLSPEELSALEVGRAIADGTFHRDSPQPVDPSATEQLSEKEYVMGPAPARRPFGGLDEAKVREELKRIDDTLLTVRQGNEVDAARQAQLHVETQPMPDETKAVSFDVDLTEFIKAQGRFIASQQKYISTGDLEPYIKAQREFIVHQRELIGGIDKMMLSDIQGEVIIHQFALLNRLGIS